MDINKQITVSAPGKIHFLGEHVVVYGKPALLAAIDKRCTVSISQRKDKRIEIRSINLKNSITVSGLAVLEGTKLAQKKWQEFIKTGNVALLLNFTKNSCRQDLRSQLIQISQWVPALGLLLHLQCA